MRVAALAVIALTAACSTGPAEGSHDHPACVDARDVAVLEGLRWLSDIELRGGQAAGPDGATFDRLFGACSAEPAAAYSDFLVRTHAGFEPAAPTGEVARRVFLTTGCGKHNPYEFAELTVDARRVCTGG